MTRNSLAQFLLVGTCALSACGGGSSGGSNGAGNNPPAQQTGVLLDAPVQGVTYTTSGTGISTSGVTGPNGIFSFTAGDTVTFSLLVGAGGSIPLGSMQVPPASTGNAVAFVGALPNGLQVAQVLQSLNFSTSTSLMNVGGLTLNATDAGNLTAFIQSGGATLPAGGYGVMMTSAQSSALTANPVLVFVVPGGVGAAAAGATLAAAASAAGVQSVSVPVTFNWANTYVGTPNGPACSACNIGVQMQVLDSTGQALASASYAATNPINSNQHAGEPPTSLSTSIGVSYYGVTPSSYTVVIPNSSSSPQNAAQVCSVTSGGSGTIVNGVASAVAVVTCHN